MCFSVPGEKLTPAKETDTKQTKLTSVSSTPIRKLPKPQLKVQYDVTELQVERANLVAEDEGTNYDVNLNVSVDTLGKLTMTMTKVQHSYFINGSIQLHMYTKDNSHLNPTAIEMQDYLIPPPSPRHTADTLQQPIPVSDPLPNFTTFLNQDSFMNQLGDQNELQMQH